MAGMNVPMNRSTGQRIGSAAVSAPRVVMSWEDWLTLAAAVVCFLSVAYSIEHARWVRDMPSVFPTSVAGLLIGMAAARIRVTGLLSHPLAIALGLGVVILGVQAYADGATLSERLSDTQARMNEWWIVVRANEISNDNLPFVFLVHSIVYVTAYLAAYSIYRWHTPWVAVLPGGLVILANLGFQRGNDSASFLFFLFGAIVLIARMHLQRNQARWRRQGVDYPEFISLSAIQLTVTVTMALIIAAWLVPLGKQASAFEGAYDAVVSPFTGHDETFGRLFSNVDSRKGARLHSFGSLLPIKGNVKLGTKTLAEVKSGSPGLVRATSYDTYTGVGWRSTERDSERVDGGALAASPDVAQYQKRNLATLQVTVRDGETSLLTAGMPLGTNKDARIETPGGFRGDIEQLLSRKTLKNGETYNTIGSESVATAQDLVSAGTNYPQWVTDRYLQLPKNLPERVRAEARTLGGATPAYVQAVAIEAYLREFPYSLDVPAAPVGRDAVDWFLFDLKQGYFDFHATAMVVMLRSQGIPARLAVGYVLDPDEVNETTYIVRKDDAYSWVEVFFPTYGWVTFNPTPDRAAGGANSNFAGTATPDTDGILDTGGFDDLFAGDLTEPDVSAAVAALQQDPLEKRELPWTLIYSLLALLAVAAVGLLGSRFAWNFGMGGLEGRARLWAKTQRLAGWAGLGSRPAETPREWSRRVGEAVAVPGEASRLAAAYEEARYGRPEAQRIADDDAASAYRRLRNALWSRVFRRKHDDPAGARTRRRKR